ncbi:MAG: 50S ribosomal protein L30 [Proteobacteria bacterium]|nr:50S ribosomal protein L30 [Pseudomonadota bacterium]
MTKAIRVKLVRSACGRIPKHRGTALGLGLRRTGDERVLEDTPAVRGMVAKIPYLVEIVEEGLSIEPSRGRG